MPADPRVRLDAIRQRADAATPGEWHVEPGRSSGCNWIDAGKYDEVIAPDRVDCGHYCYGGSSRIELSDKDAEFIAHARQDVPQLAAALEAVLDEAGAAHFSPKTDWQRGWVSAMGLIGNVITDALGGGDDA